MEQVSLHYEAVRPIPKIPCRCFHRLREVQAYGESSAIPRHHVEKPTHAAPGFEHQLSLELRRSKPRLPPQPSFGVPELRAVKLDLREHLPLEPEGPSVTLRRYKAK